jgi:serine/threonine protein kinase
LNCELTFLFSNNYSRDLKQSFYQGFHRQSLQQQQGQQQVFEKVIIKEFHLQQYPLNDTSILSEIMLLSSLSHPGLPSLREYFITDHSIYFILDPFPDRTLADCIASSRSNSSSNKKNKLSSYQIRSVMNQLFAIVHYCHERDIVIRDMTPRNIAIERVIEGPTDEEEDDDEDDDIIVKIIDLSFAVSLRATKDKNSDNNNNNSQNTSVHPHLAPLSDHVLFDWYLVKYAAPEVVLSKRFTCQSDMWSLGVLLFEMLMKGKHPFDHLQDHILIQRIARCQYAIDREEWETVDEYGRYLVESLLRVQPTDRLTASHCVEHVWIHNNGDE